MVGLVGLGLLIATVLCLTMLRIRKLRLDELREQANALKMLSTNIYENTSTNTIAALTNNTFTGEDVTVDKK